MTQCEEFEEWYEREGQSKPFTTVSIKDKMHEAWQAAKTRAVPEVSQSISNPMPSGYMLNTLIKFQKWRIGEDERTLDETGLTPKLITQAIDWAIEQLDKSVAQAVPDKGE